MILFTFDLIKRRDLYLLCSFHILLFRYEYLCNRTVPAICQAQKIRSSVKSKDTVTLIKKLS